MSAMRPWIVPLPVAASLAALLSAPPSAAAAPRTHVIGMERMQFAAAPSGIRLGDTIVWVNRDVVRHTATARDGSFDVELPPKARVRMVVRKAGAFSFYCRYHPGMRGALRVSAR